MGHDHALGAEDPPDGILRSVVGKETPDEGEGHASEHEYGAGALEESLRGHNGEGRDRRHGQARQPPGKNGPAWRPRRIC